MSIIDMEDLKNYQSNTVVRSLEEILEDCDSFNIVIMEGLYKYPARQM